MGDVYPSNVHRDSLIEGYRRELASARSKEQKAAIAAELEKLTGSRTADEYRADIETRTGPAPITPPTHVAEFTVEEQRARHVAEEGR